MTGKYVLREYFKLCEGGVCQDYLTEGEKIEVKNGAMYLTGVAQRADAKNGNGRIYPHRVLAPEVENYKKIVREGRALGELDHPEETVINLKNASHLVTDIWWEGKEVMVKLKVLSGEPGRQLRSLVNDGVAIGLSSRGLGDVRESREGSLVENYQLVCFDVVSEPSVGGAFMHLMENRNRIQLEKPDRIYRLLNDILRKE